jgi:hypothetical protein
MACLGRGQVHLGSVDLHEGWLTLNAAQFVMLDSFHVALQLQMNWLITKKHPYLILKFNQKQFFLSLGLLYLIIDFVCKVSYLFIKI